MPPGAEVGELPAVAVPERGQVHAGGEGAARVRERRVERVDVADADMAQQSPSLPQSTWGLGAWNVLEPTVQPGQRVFILSGELGGDLRPSLGQESFHALVPPVKPCTSTSRSWITVPVEVTSARTHASITCTRGMFTIDRVPARAGAAGEAEGCPRPGTPHRAPIDHALAGDLGIGGAGGMQGAETTDVHPGLESRIMDRSPLGLGYIAVDVPDGDPAQGEQKTQLAEADLHIRSYAERHIRLSADSFAVGC